MKDIVKRLNEIFDEFHVQSVGNGYIDCICPKESIEGFISELDKLNIKIEGFTWWCFSNENHPPCGMGGPKNKYGEGFYSEMGNSGLIKFQSNEEYKHYLLENFQKSNDYKDCLRPGFWLKLPRK